MITRVRAHYRSHPLRLHLNSPMTLPETHSRFPAGYVAMRSSEVFEIVFRLSQDDFLNSMTSIMIRAIPPIGGIVIEIEEFRKSFWKEFNATQRDDRPPVLEYLSWFSKIDDTPIHPLIPKRIAVSRRIKTIFMKFRQRISGRPLMPTYSRKTMSTDTQGLLGIKRSTGADWIRHYHRTGQMVGGDMEMRQSFKFNDLTPRTYFAQGGDVLSSSLYAQPIFMTLVDSNVVTHRKTRFDLGRLAIDSSEDLWIYDYSSFTSNMAEIKYFLYALGVDCIGTLISIWDPFYGLMEIDLGEYILHYNKVTNCNAKFRIGPVITKRLDFSGTFEHRVAGALGTYGNIAACTALHGICLYCICGADEKCSCVGDDGIAILPKTQPMELEEGEVVDVLQAPFMIRDALRLLGDINDSKFSVLDGTGDPDTFTYLKRTLDRFEDRIRIGTQEHLLNLDLIIKLTASTLRGSVSGSDIYRSCMVFASSVLSFQLQVFRDPSLDEHYLRMATQYLISIYDELELPTCGSNGNWSFTGIGWHREATRQKEVKRPVIRSSLMPIPSHVDLWYHLRSDPMERFRLMHPKGDYKIPVLVMRSTYPFQPIENVVGAEAYGIFGKGVTLLRDLGYLELSDVEEWTDDTDLALNRIVDLASKRFVVLRKIWVKWLIPDSHVDMLYI